MAKPPVANPIVAKPITPARLQNYALWYLQKQFPSKNWLRKKLVQFSSQKKPTDQAMQDILPMVDNLLGLLEKENIIDDKRLAASLARQWQERLMPFRKIESKLMAKGFERETIENIKNQLENNNQLADEETMARDYAARKKLGAWRMAHEESHEENNEDNNGNESKQTKAQKNYQKDLAKMARAGFSYNAAQKALKKD